MANTHRSPISAARLERNRDAKRPTSAEMEQASREFPNDFGAAVRRALDLASERNRRRVDPFIIHPRAVND